MTRRLLSTLMLMLPLAACTPTELEEVTSESWAGDVGTTNMMMMMAVAHRGTNVSGSGSISALIVPGSALYYTISGMRRGDTLDLLLKRSGEEVHFVGAYSSKSRIGLTGTLCGGDYYGTTVVLRRQ